MRPGVVWFGEALPEDAWREAERRMRTADALLIVGTSGVVWPAAGLPAIAARQGTPIVEISPADTDLTDLATWSIRATAAEGVPALLATSAMVEKEIRAMPDFSNGLVVGFAVSAVFLFGMQKRST